MSMGEEEVPRIAGAEAVDSQASHCIVLGESAEGCGVCAGPDQAELDAPVADTGP